MTGSVSGIGQTEYSQFDGSKRAAENNVVSAFNVPNATQSSDIAPTTPQADETNKPKRTQADIDKAILEIIKNYDITLEDAKELFRLTRSGLITDTELENLDDSTFNKYKICLINALKDIAVDGKVDKNILKQYFIGYKINIVFKGKSVEDARKSIEEFKNSDFIDILRKYDSSLAGRDIKDISPQELKESLKKVIYIQKEKGSFDKFKTSDKKDRMVTYFIALINKCSPEEKSKLFEAFALLTKDADMKETFKEMYNSLPELLSSKENKEVLNKILLEVAPLVLKDLGFSQGAIDALNLETISKLSPEQMQNVIGGLAKILDAIDKNDIEPLKRICNLVVNGQIESLTDDDIRLLDKYEGLLSNISTTLVAVAAKDETGQIEGIKVTLEKLLERVEKFGLKKYIYYRADKICNEIKEKFKDVYEKIFNGLSIEDIYKQLDLLTNNEFSKTINSGTVIIHEDVEGRIVPDKPTAQENGSIISYDSGVGFVTPQAVPKQNITAQDLSTGFLC